MKDAFDRSLTYITFRRAYATVPQVAGAPATQEKRPVGAHTPAAGNAPVTGNNAAGTTMYPAAQSARPSDVTAV